MVHEFTHEPPKILDDNSIGSAILSMARAAVPAQVLHSKHPTKDSKQTSKQINKSEPYIAQSGRTVDKPIRYRNA